MKTNPWCVLASAALMTALAFLNSGCSTTQVRATERPAPVVAEPAPVAPTSMYGPSYSTFQENGVTWRRGSVAFPTGKLASSGLLLEKAVPDEVMVGSRINYLYSVKNITEVDIANVTVFDRVTGAFDMSSSTPEAVDVSDGIATWYLGDLAPGESKQIVVAGVAKEEGTITTCGWATFDPIICEPIRVVKANLKLVKQGPAEVLICDPIPYTLTVQNTGSSVLTGVKVVDQLPEGLTANGSRTVSFDAGTLQPGASRQFTFTANASRTGRFVNPAKATSTQGVEAESSAATIVRQPVLTINCETPDERFAGRPITICLTVANSGDATSAGTVVEMPLPAGVNFNGATAGGRLVGNNVVWDVGSLPADSTKELCATVISPQPNTVRFVATAKGDCAAQVSTTCETVVAGIPAILLEVIDLDDPIEVGSNVVYEIVVTNQGSAPGTGIRVECELENEQQFVSGTGATSVSGSGQTVRMAPVTSLAPKAKATWRVTVKALEESNVRFKVKMISDQMTRDVEETESTNQY